jgi:hypothetical protein
VRESADVPTRVCVCEVEEWELRIYIVFENQGTDRMGLVLFRKKTVTFPFLPLISGLRIFTMSTTSQHNAHGIINRTQIAFLGIIREDGSPTIRPIEVFAPVGPGEVSVYFSTPGDSAKSKALRQHPRTTFFFQPEGIEISAYKGASLIGDAVEILPDAAEYSQAIAILVARSPYFKSRVEKGEIAGMTVFRINAVEVRYSDYAAPDRSIQNVVL